MAIWLKQNKPRAVVHHTLEGNTNNNIGGQSPIKFLNTSSNHNQQSINNQTLNET